MAALDIIQKAKDEGIKDGDQIFGRVRDEMHLSNEETRKVLNDEGFGHDGLLDPRKTTLGRSKPPYGFAHF